MLILKPRQPHGLVLAMSCSQLRQSYGCGVGDVEFTAKTVVRMWCWRCRVHSQDSRTDVMLAMSSSQPRQSYGCDAGDVEFTAKAILRTQQRWV